MLKLPQDGNYVGYDVDHCDQDEAQANLTTYECIIDIFLRVQ